MDKRQPSPDKRYLVRLDTIKVWETSKHAATCHLKQTRKAFRV